VRCYAEYCAWQQHAILKLVNFLTFLLMKYGELIVCRQILEYFRAVVLNDFHMVSIRLTKYESRCDLSPWLNLIRRRSHSIEMGRGVTETNHHLPRAWLRWSLVTLLLSSQDHNWALSVQYFSSTTGKYSYSPFQWPSRPRHGSVAPRLLGFWVWILPEAWISASWECCVLSGGVSYIEPITRPEESYRVWCV
jgi:hypothetical protein